MFTCEVMISVGRKRADVARRCEQINCTNKHYAKGMCKYHYWKCWNSRNGNVDGYPQEPVSLNQSG